MGYFVFDHLSLFGHFSQQAISMFQKKISRNNLVFFLFANDSRGAGWSGAIKKIPNLRPWSKITTAPTIPLKKLLLNFRQKYTTVKLKLSKNLIFINNFYQVLEDLLETANEISEELDANICYVNNYLDAVSPVKLNTIEDLDQFQVKLYQIMRVLLLSNSLQE